MGFIGAHYRLCAITSMAHGSAPRGGGRYRDNAVFAKSVDSYAEDVENCAHRKREEEMIREFLRRIDPRAARRKQTKFDEKALELERDSKIPLTEAVFDEIYRNGIWGKNKHGLSTSGSGSHTKAIVAPYLEAVRKVASEYSLKTAVDLGCGDFAVGSKIFDIFDHYTACDISSVILERNRELYRAPSLEFRQIDLANDDLPSAEVAFVRQVLQHLSNKEIIAFVQQVNEKRCFKYLVITEHIPFGSAFTANVDQPSGPDIRVGINSGVILHRDPFNLRYKSRRDICVVEEADRSPLAQSYLVGTSCEVCETAEGIKAIIKSTLYIL